LKNVKLNWQIKRKEIQGRISVGFGHVFAVLKNIINPQSARIDNASLRANIFQNNFFLKFSIVERNICVRNGSDDYFGIFHLDFLGFIWDFLRQKGYLDFCCKFWIAFSRVSPSTFFPIWFIPSKNQAKKVFPIFCERIRFSGKEKRD